MGTLKELADRYDAEVRAKKQAGIDLRKWEYSPANNGYYINDGVMINFKEAERWYNSLLDYALAEKQRADEAKKPFWKPIEEFKENIGDWLVLKGRHGYYLRPSAAVKSEIGQFGFTHYAEIPALPKEGTNG